MSLLSELQRRNVIRMAGLYLVGAWLVVQVAANLMPVFEAPGWVMKALVVLLAIGFCAASMFSWVVELTPGVLKRDDGIAVGESSAPQIVRRPVSRQPQPPSRDPSPCPIHPQRSSTNLLSALNGRYRGVTPCDAGSNLRRGVAREWTVFRTVRTVPACSGPANPSPKAPKKPDSSFPPSSMRQPQGKRP